MSLVVAALLMCLPGVHAAEPAAASVTPPWLEEDAMRAAMAINMDDTQRSQFAAALRTFMEGYQKSVDKTLMRSNVADPAAVIGRKRSSLAKQMDRSAAEFLTEAQLPRYTDYRNLLMSKLADDVDRYMGIASDDDVHIGPTATH